MQAQAQADPMRRMQGMGRSGQSGTTDSLQRRTGLEDSITIRFRYLDSTRMQFFDSSLSDFSRRYPSPWNYVNLGNTGTAARNLLFEPNLKSGWDHGFHSFDLYNFTPEETRFYNTTRPYSEIGYVLGSQVEQMINLIHTQNIMPNWNMALQYRLINAPGFFLNQNSNHNNYRLSSWYQSKNKRYQNQVILIGNKLQVSENGGIRDTANYLDDPAYAERSTIPTYLGPDTRSRNVFNSNINTGTKYTNATYMMRQQYDIGQKDSIVTDSSVIPLFYPRLRLEHTISYNTYKYRFTDDQVDTSYYRPRYHLNDTLRLFRQDHWRVLSNDFSFYTFPDAKNPQQFFKAGATIQNLSGSFDTGLVKATGFNFFLHGEYRNKTRNQKWDIEALGNFYAGGFNAGDYDAYISLKRLISPKIGYLQAGFQNVSRTPSFTFDNRSSFYLSDRPDDFKKENTIHIFGSLDQPRFRLKLTAGYFLVSNYTYFRDYYVPDQSSAIFNVLRLGAEKQFSLGRRFNWRTWILLQQKAGDAPVNLPLFITRNQFAYEGNLGFKNLQLSTGLEFRYFTPYKASAYSPLTGQFFYQDSATVRMKLPEITAFMNFRIRSFTAYLRVENLNSYSFSRGGFVNNNVLTLGYPSPGMVIRLGIFWSFVN